MAVNDIQQLPFNAVGADNQDVDKYDKFLDLSAFNIYNINDKFDHSILSQIDPDMNYP